MNLTIINKDNLELDDFCTWLVGIIQEAMREVINPKKMLARDEKLNKVITYTVNQTLSSEVIVKLAINNLNWRRVGRSSYEIYINDKIKIYGTKNTLYEVTKYLEYGGVGLEPLYLFRNMFDSVANNLNKYYLDYLQMIGG